MFPPPPFWEMGPTDRHELESARTIQKSLESFQRLDTVGAAPRQCLAVTGRTGMQVAHRPHEGGNQSGRSPSHEAGASECPSVLTIQIPGALCPSPAHDVSSAACRHLQTRLRTAGHHRHRRYGTDQDQHSQLYEAVPKGPRASPSSLLNEFRLGFVAVWMSDHQRG